MLKVSIFDGYVDEPTCLGVPPYMSPYPRYIAGAVWDHDPRAAVSYVTIDQVRKDRSWIGVLSDSDLVVVVAGMSVPGKYLSGLPASPHELFSIFGQVTGPLRVLTGPAARYGFGVSGGKKMAETTVVKDVFDVIASGDGEIVVSELLENRLDAMTVDPSVCRGSPREICKMAVKGAAVVRQHPFFPEYLITEIETYRGCPRSIVGGCSFCSEPQKGPPSFRTVNEICGEVEALYKTGVRHVRIGNQPCIFSYMARGAGELEFPRPDPGVLEKLFRGIRSVAPGLKTLHIDNANPGVLARYPEESREIAKSIIKYHSSGDVAALGVESVDPVVVKKNNLKVSAEEAVAAVRLLNDVGSKRGMNGLPELLPGLNFVFGLEGETNQTFRVDYEFLRGILDEGLLVRRINMRQVIPIPGTAMAQVGERIMHRHKAEFQRFKRKVRETIERPLLRRLVPPGTILRNLYAELYEGKLTFARQLGSYPLLVGIPGVFPLHRFYDVKVVDYGYRSVTGVPFPLDINHAPREAIEALPGVGKKRGIRILANRPFQRRADLVASLDDPGVAAALDDFVCLG